MRQNDCGQNERKQNVCRQNGSKQTVCRQNDCIRNNIDSINGYRISPGGTRMIEILTVNETK